MSKKLSIKNRSVSGNTYGTPEDPNFTVRFKNTESKKTLEGVSLTNHVTEIIWNASLSATIGDDQVQDPVSIRVRVSGAYETLSKRKELLAQVAKDLAVYATDDTIAGFEPSSAPSTPFLS